MMNSVRCIKFFAALRIPTESLKIQNLRRISQLAVSASPSVADLQVNSQQISKYMKYLSVETTEKQTKPLVVIYGWLMSKERHYRKIHDFYLEQGFDVLKLQITPRMQLWPITIKPVVSNMLEFLLDKSHSDKPLLLHGFSVGGYMYADTIYTILQNPDRYGAVAERVFGHVSDSPVDVVGAANGISKSVTDSKILQKFIEKSVDSYLAVFKRQCTDYMWIAHRMYHENPLGIPTLYLYSTNDVISSLDPIYHSMSRSKEQNIPYFKYEFDTPHVQHFRSYPKIYRRNVEEFLDYIKIKETDPQFRKDVWKRIAAFPL